MKRILFVSNGHGEAAIADRIAQALHRLAPGMALEHLPLVGDAESRAMTDVGPVRAMPSGGLIAMGNARNIARDVAAGLIGLTFAQARFLRAARGRYAAVAAVGDVYALMVSALAGAPTIFVGTAKSVRVAPYGAIEERLLRRAAARFVRDEPTARRLAAHGVPVEPAANVIVDLAGAADDPQAEAALGGFEPALVLLPGSRAGAYADAALQLTIVRELARAHASLGAVISIARGVDDARVAAMASDAGWNVENRGADGGIPFSLALDGRVRVRAWRGALGPLLAGATLVLGQAGTANEAAAAAGRPVIAFERERAGKVAWYRRRQQGLLGDALRVLPADVAAATAAVSALLGDPQRQARMAAEGRARMGAAGGAQRIAARILDVANVAQ